VPTEAHKRRTQTERRRETRGLILDATVQSLIERGYARTTTLEVQKRAGVSRGALLHHFPSKAELMAAVVRHLAMLRGVELSRRAGLLPEGGDRIGAVLDLLWEGFRGPLFHVAMELRIAARTDVDLRAILVDVERELRGHIIARCRELFGPRIASRPGFERAMDISLQLMIGSAMTEILHRGGKGLCTVQQTWKELLPQLLEKTE
jgi:AcrR family transcriptional regulator